jgi:hypothetical protein
MAQQYSCDICQAEPAAQMLTNTETGDVMMLGLLCLPVFYMQSMMTLIDAGEHTRIPAKCQACRRIHEWVAVTMSPLVPEAPPLDPDPGDLTEAEYQAYTE